MDCVNRANVSEYVRTVATSTTEASVEFDRPLVKFTLAAVTQNCRVSINAPITISTTPDAYMWNNTAGTLTAMTYPLVLDSMGTSDVLFVGVLGREIQSIVVNIDGTKPNGNAATLTPYYFTKQGVFGAGVTVSDLTAMALISDGTVSGGKTFGQDGTIELGGYPQLKAVSFAGVGRVWVGFKPSSALDSEVEVTGLTCYGPHRLLTAAAAATSYEARVYKLYHIAAGTGTLNITGFS